LSKGSRYSFVTTGKSSAAIVLLVCLLSVVTILIYPFHMFQGFSQIDPLGIIPDPYVFSIAVSLMLLTYAWLMYTFGTSKWSAIFVLTTSVVFGLMTYKMEPFGVDHEYGITLTDASYVGVYHHFSQPLVPNVGYLAYPGISLLTYAMGKVLNLSLVQSASALHVALYPLVAVSIYLLATRLVENPFLASMSIVLIFAFSLIGSNMTLFFPLTLGLTYFVLAITLIKERFGNNSLIAFGVLYSGMIITHFYDPLDMIFILGILMIPILGIKSKNFLHPFVLSMVVFISYLAYQAQNYFNSLVPGIFITFTHLLSYHSFGYISQVAVTNTVKIPLWATFIRYFDIITTSIFGTLIAAWLLISALRGGSRHSNYTYVVSLMCIGIIMFGFLAFLSSLGSGGGFDLLVGPQYVPVTSVPILIFFLSKYRRLMIVFAVCLAVLAAPSLFALTYHQISTISVYPDEITLSNYFLNHQTGNLTLATDPKTGGIILSVNPAYKLIYIQEPLASFPYYPQYYNIIYPAYSFYQLHLYGFAPSLQTILYHNIVYSNGYSFILPPQLS
jgi:hypothetical protein